MNHNGKRTPIPFGAPSAVPIVGQPITVRSIAVPINVVFDCNCGGEHPPVEIVLSQPGRCEGCGKVYVVTFAPPPGGQMQIHIVAQPEAVVQ